MKNKIKKLSFVLALAAMFVPFASWAKWSIQDVKQTAEGAGLTTEKSFVEIISTAINWMMTLLTIVSVLMFVVAGIMYVTANGDEETIGKAKKIITFGITGMAISLCGFLIVEVVNYIVGESV